MTDGMMSSCARKCARALIEWVWLLISINGWFWTVRALGMARRIEDGFHTCAVFVFPCALAQRSPAILASRSLYEPEGHISSPEPPLGASSLRSPH